MRMRTRNECPGFFSVATTLFYWMSIFLSTYFDFDNNKIIIIIIVRDVACWIIFSCIYELRVLYIQYNTYLVQYSTGTALARAID